MVPRRSVGLVGVVLGAAILTGCTDTAAEPPPAPVTTARSAETPAPSESSAPVVDVLEDEDAAEGAQVAVAAMTAFSARDRSYEVWWADFGAYLTPEARHAFEYTDPANVPATAVTDAGQVVAAPSSTQMTALVGTDVGQYRVELVRQSVEDPWLVHGLTPPDGVS